VSVPRSDTSNPLLYNQPTLKRLSATHAYMSAGAFSPNFLVGDTSMGAEKDAVANNFDPRKTVVMADITPKETTVTTVLPALQALLQATDLGAEKAVLSELHMQLGKKGKFAVPTFAKNTKSKKVESLDSDSAGPGLILSSRDGKGILQKLGQVTISKWKVLQGGHIMIELDGPEPIVQGKGDMDITDDVCFSVKMLLMLYKQNRGKLRLPNPKFVAGGDEPEHIRIDQIVSSRVLNWKLGPCVKAYPSSRQPFSQMSDFGSTPGARIATTFSIIGTDNPNSINVAGCTVLPPGVFSNFLFLVFNQKNEEVRFLLCRDQLEAAISQNVVLEIGNGFNMTQINFLRSIVSQAMAGHQVSADDRRRGKQLLVDISTADMGAPAPLALNMKQGNVMEWHTCFQNDDSGDYFPALYLSTAENQALKGGQRGASWPALDPNLSKSTNADYTQLSQNVRTNLQQGKDLSRIVAQTVKPVLNTRKVPLYALNAIALSSPSVTRAAKRFYDLTGSEACILGSFFDESPEITFKYEVSADSAIYQVVVSTPQFETKQTEVQSFSFPNRLSDLLFVCLLSYIFMN